MSCTTGFSRLNPYFEQLQLLLVGEALDVGCLHVSLQVQLLPPQQGQGVIKRLLHVCKFLLQQLLPVLQFAVLQWKEENQKACLL